MRNNSVFKDISFLELWQLFCLVERNHLCNFGRGHHEEQFCEIILNLDTLFRRCGLETFRIKSFGGPIAFSGVEPFVQIW